MSHSQSLGSSPGKPNIKEKNALKKKLAALDRKLSELQKFKCSIVVGIHPNHTSGYFHKILYPDRYKKLLEMDLKRKKVRNKLKGY